ncbi:MAG: DUF2974 domain-containing protein [Clostridia bacterium]|nr:DUF2974 domain-containing protein [Clostridia bacterium]
MANIMNYLDWRGDLTFEQSPFNEVDNYILCKLGCPDFGGIVPEKGEVAISEAVNRYFAAHENKDISLGLLTSPFVLTMIRRLPETARFGSLVLCDFINRVDPNREEQFSVLTIELPDGVRFVSFRGTDDTIMAWKEDFLLSVWDVIPAQRDAAEYLLREAERKPGRLMVGGHSKGGNLSVFASLVAPEEIQERILAIYNNDGPGFRRDYSSTPAYARLKPKLHTIVPQHTIVGKLQYHEEDCAIVKSSQSGLAAHDGFNWEVLGTKFVRSADYSLGSKAFEAALLEISSQMDTEERRVIIEELFAILTSTGAVTLTDLTERRLRQALELAQGIRKSPEVRKFIQSLLTMMARETVSNARISVPIPKIRGSQKKMEDNG